MFKEIEVHVTGKVQMVMFRDFVQRHARAFGLVGTVENTRDRSLRVVAQGLESSLNKLIEKLHKGPFLAKVANVSVVWREPKEEFEGFSIIYD